MSLRFPDRRFLTISKSSGMKTWCRSSATGLFCVTPLTPGPFAKSCNFFMPSAAPATRRLKRETLFNFANRRTAMPETSPEVEVNIKEIVREKYGQAALRVTNKSGGSSCCGAAPASASCLSCDPITANLYDAAQAGQIPEDAMLASLGRGNPTALAQLNVGETVLDLGSGGGIDVLLSARRVGPSGKAYGLDMTDEMLVLANETKRKSGAENMEFLKGEIENIPLPDNSVDVIISNCVINLSADKDRVLREAFRVLKPGGRFAVSDVVTRGSVPDAVRQSMLLWVGCIAGALEEQQYRSKLAGSGFTHATLEPTRIYNVEDARQF